MKKALYLYRKTIICVLVCLILGCFSLYMLIDMTHPLPEKYVFISRENLYTLTAAVDVSDREIHPAFPVRTSDLRFDDSHTAKARIDKRVDDTLLSVSAASVSPSPPIISREEQEAAARAKFEKARIERLRNRIPDYSRSDIHKLDLTLPSGIIADDLREIGSYSGLRGLENAFVNAEKRYNVNCMFMYSLAVIESAGGTQMYRPNNMFGFMGKSFSSKAACIDYVTGRISANYLSPGGPFYRGKTISAVNVKYSTSSTWDDKIERVMYRMYLRARANNLAKYD